MLSDDALNTLAEIEADARDLAAWSPEEIDEFEASAHAAAWAAMCEAADVRAAMAAELAEATHDAAGFPLCDSFPW